jgi:hypothetical protein
VHIDAHFSNKSYTIQMSMIQYVVLLLIQQYPGKTYYDIHNLLRVHQNDSDYVKGILHSLCRSKYALILKSGMSDTIHLFQDTFCINPLFYSSQSCMIIPLPQFTTTPTMKIQNESIYILRCKIIQIMKKHESLSLTSLMEYMYPTSQNKKMIEKQVDYLIQQEYIEKTLDDLLIYIP